MSSSSKDIYIPMFSGEHFDHWSVKMKTILISEDLWEYVEDGYEAPNPTLMLTAEQKQQLRENRKNDAKALSIIQRGVSSRFFRTILNAKTAKEAWDNLHKELQMDASTIAAQKVDNSPRMEPMLSSSSTPLIEHVEGTSKPKPMLSSPDIYHLDEEGITPLLELPFYDLMLSKAHVGPTYQMSFPPSLDSKLPSTTVPSIIKCFGKTWELKFCGDMTPKCFDSSWRKFVDDNNLVVGDALIFELLESSSVKVMFKVQFLSCAIPPELQEQINKSRAERQAIIIDDE
ncbi:B3 domain-containing protein Os06g0112300-like isoform X4 [Olea europaea var. sylvestris]|uniref:B3 domain-containing protein Os06g0112300-like isoform X4 n=1 Tax=Olea europaea var. sylvestris TaxID=158386 RepID=UPI000C1D67F4|nr:B3 domain-containing protein Os06g0112300-like isoform X4 [Olea europaea var. sylvestris]